MDRSPMVDHTGEIHNNRLITGPGHYHKPPSGHGFWSWCWECLECGATGEAHNYGQIKFWSHFCPGKVRGRPKQFTATTPTKPRKPRIDWSKCCSSQCRDCGHYDDYCGACLYILDTGHMRPRVDLRHDPCPVKDRAFKRRIVSTPLDIGTPEAVSDARIKAWNDDKEELR